MPVQFQIIIYNRSDISYENSIFFKTKNMKLESTETNNRFKNTNIFVPEQTLYDISFLRDIIDRNSDRQTQTE